MTQIWISDCCTWAFYVDDVLQTPDKENDIFQATGGFFGNAKRGVLGRLSLGPKPCILPTGSRVAMEPIGWQMDRADTKTRSHTQVWMPCGHIPQKHLQATNSFVFPAMLSTPKSQKMPNHTNTWGYQQELQWQRTFFWKITNHERHAANASRKCLALTFPPGKKNHSGSETKSCDFYLKVWQHSFWFLLYKEMSKYGIREQIRSRCCAGAHSGYTLPSVGKAPLSAS